MLAEGVLTEVLSWKMDVEEPDAAAIISEAQNLSNHMSMRTSELTAVAVLKGQIIAEMAKTSASALPSRQCERRCALSSIMLPMIQT